MPYKNKEIAKKMGYPMSSTKGRHKFINSKTKKEYTGDVYGGMGIEDAMEFERRRKEQRGLPKNTHEK